jgi:hypothetical protein
VLAETIEQQNNGSGIFSVYCPRTYLLPVAALNVAFVLRSKEAEEASNAERSKMHLTEI